jgi:N-acetylmuramoyl-L-alanine amidase CwlA
MLSNGIIQEKEIYGCPVVADLIPTTNTKARPAYPMKASSITIHETGNKRVGANAAMHTEYVDRVQSNVSWHFTVDDECIYQELPITENAWHAGDGATGTGNRTSIAIEICVNEDCDFRKAKLNAKKLVQYLMRAEGLKEIYPHQHWSGKDCPHNILLSGWNDFVNFLHANYSEDFTNANDAIEHLAKHGRIGSPELWKTVLQTGVIKYIDLVFIGWANDVKNFVK